MQYSSERRARSCVCGRRHVSEWTKAKNGWAHLELLELLLLLFKLVEALLNVLEQVLDLVALGI